jgi:hypothetical protein
VLRKFSISGGYIERERAVPLVMLHIEIVSLPESVRERIAACVVRVDERGGLSLLIVTAKFAMKLSSVLGHCPYQNRTRPVSMWMKLDRS